ncbi:hypothetical protein [Sphingomonas koreensis]
MERRALIPRRPAVHRVPGNWEPPLPAYVPPPRETCFLCGATSMHGCEHLRARGIAA